MAKAKYDGRKNLIPVHDHETAVMLGKRSAEAIREIIIARWEQLTGEKAVKAEGGSGD